MAFNGSFREYLTFLCYLLLYYPNGGIGNLSTVFAVIINKIALFATISRVNRYNIQIKDTHKPKI